MQKAAAGVRDTGAAAKAAGANLAGFDAALAAVGEDGATVLGPPAIALQDLGISAQGAQGDVTLLGTELAAIGDDGATNLAPLRQGLLLVGDEAVIAGADVTGLGTALTTLGTDGGAAFNILSAKLSDAVREIDLLKARLAGLQPGLAPKLRDDVEGVGRASRSSAGQVANLTAQFNDIGMMMASGQNPLMTAIQQGSQVGQVIGPMGAAGAVKALGAGFMAMLSPLNLGVMAAIAFGSVLVQWLVSGGEKVKSLDDAVGDLKSSVTALQTAAHRSLADLQKDFGDVTPEVKHLNDELADLAAVQSIIAATEAMKALKAETRATWWEWSTTNFGLNADKVKISERLQVPLSVPGTVQYRGVTPTKDNPDIQRFQDAVAAAEAAATRNIDVQLAAFGNLRAIFIDMTGGIGGMTKAQAEFLAKVDETEAALRRLKVAQSPGLTPQAGRAEAGYAPTPEDAKASADLIAARQKATALTQTEVAQNQLAAALQHQIAVFGADSARAAYARLAAERDAYAVLLNQRGVSGTLADNAMSAWDAYKGIAESSMAATIEAARAASDGRHDIRPVRGGTALSQPHHDPGAGHRPDGRAMDRHDAWRADPRFLAVGRNPVLGRRHRSLLEQLT